MAVGCGTANVGTIANGTATVGIIVAIVIGATGDWDCLNAVAAPAFSGPRALRRTVVYAPSKLKPDANRELWMD